MALARFCSWLRSSCIATAIPVGLCVIRTYNYKENRVTDHRIGFTLYQLQDVLAGNLTPVVEALIADERAKQLASGDA